MENIDVDEYSAPSGCPQSGSAYPADRIYAEIVLPWLLTFLSFRDNAMLPSGRLLPGAPSFPGQVVTPTNGEEHISRRNIISL